MFRPVTIKENGTRRKVPFIEAFLSGLVHLAVNGIRGPDATCLNWSSAIRGW